MRRPLIVIVATVAGLVAVLSFHTSPSNHLTFGALPTTPIRRAAPTTTTAPPPTSTSAGGGTPRTTTSPPTTSPPTTMAPAPTTTTAPPSTTRTATGESVNYHYGVLSVTVTVKGSTITDVGIASLDDGGSPRSQSIDEQAIPLLEQQAIEAQSANIQGVSGASYTSQGFAQSLQSALSQLNFP